MFFKPSVGLGISEMCFVLMPSWLKQIAKPHPPGQTKQALGRETEKIFTCGGQSFVFNRSCCTKRYRLRKYNVGIPITNPSFERYFWVLRVGRYFWVLSDYKVPGPGNELSTESRIIFSTPLMKHICIRSAIPIIPLLEGRGPHIRNFDAKE